MKEKLWGRWAMWAAVASLQSSALKVCSNEIITPCKTSLSFSRGKPAFQLNLAPCVSNTDAQVPGARQLNYSLIIPSSEIWVNHHFPSNSEKKPNDHRNYYVLQHALILRRNFIASYYLPWQPRRSQGNFHLVEKLRKSSTKEFPHVLRVLVKEWSGL